MRELKLQLNIFSPRDYLRIEQHLCRMAEKGWMLEQVDRFFWRYKICEPKKLRFSVLFFQELDWEEPYKQQCKAAGWQFVSGFAGMQIFCTEDPDLAPIEIAPTPRWKAIHTSTITRDRAMWRGLSLLAFVVLINSVITAFSDPIEVLADGPRLMYCILMLGIWIFVAADAIHYYHWRNKARRQFHKVGTLAELKGNLIGLTIGLGILVVLALVVLVVEDSYGRIVTLLNIGSIVLSLLAMAAYRLLRKRKSADTPVKPVVSLSIAAVTFLVLGIIQSAMLGNWDVTCQPEDMKLTVQALVEDAEDGTCLIEEQSSIVLSDLTGRNIVAGEEDAVLWYRITIAKYPELIDFVHERSLPQKLHGKLEEQDAALWQAERVWLHISSNDMYTYYIYYADRGATLMASWELSQEQITVATQALMCAQGAGA